MPYREIRLPLDRDTAAGLRAGDILLLSGDMYTARDAAHKRMVEMLDRGEALPVELEDQIIYYCGPCPAPEGRPIGSAGPTTSGRMDRYAPRLIERGLRGMVGKGLRSAEVVEAMKKHTAVYFGATGGAGALLARRIVSSEVVAFGDLGTEAVRRIRVDRFPVTVVIDSLGNDLYATGRQAYRKP
ncbi:MAG: Fe-S-containing hydro-lyase [Clostridia bacterium]|nr:Fe-S-containing hydro-lyase [Clostridia bacterium]